MPTRRRKPLSTAIPGNGAVLLALVLLVAACGAAPGPGHTGKGPKRGHAAMAPLAPGRGSAPAPALVEGAARLARRFARAWAAAVYRRR
ncbi:MAG TPA: hypothetical protein VFI13_03420, partial [Gemmatimonadales bacterium]|nr:hypothetical protein [Gemmatimonadales bacterium]